MADYGQDVSTSIEISFLNLCAAPFDIKVKFMYTLYGRKYQATDTLHQQEPLGHRKQCHEAQGPRLCVDVNARGGLVSRALPTFTVASAFSNSAL